MWKRISSSISSWSASERSRARTRLYKPFSHMPSPRSCRLHHLAYGQHQKPPVLFLDAEPPAARGRQRVEARAAVVLRLPPLALYPAALLQAVERRVERSLLDPEHLLGQ